VGIEIQSAAPALGRKRSVTLHPASAFIRNTCSLASELYRDVAIWIQMWEVSLQKPPQVLLLALAPNAATRN
jgi:hypothetical protein